MSNLNIDREEIEESLDHLRMYWDRMFSQDFQKESPHKKNLVRSRIKANISFLDECGDPEIQEEINGYKAEKLL